MIEDKSIKQEVIRKEIKSISCDGSGCNNKETLSPSKGVWNDWDEDSERTEVSANLIIGGGYVSYDFDVCPSCFMQKIVPLFNGEGVENRVEKIKNKVEKMCEVASAEQKQAEESAKNSNSMSRQAEYLGYAARAMGKQMALRDVLVLIRNLA